MADLTKEKPYQRLVNYLLDKDKPVFVADLPKEHADLRLLNAAWIDGMVEFGRREYVLTGEASHDSVFHVGVCIVEDGMSWTGPRSNKHKSLKDTLEEDKSLPENCRRQKKIESPTQKGTYEIVKEPVSNDLLRLQVRITDKAYAALAAA